MTTRTMQDRLAVGVHIGNVLRHARTACGRNVDGTPLSAVRADLERVHKACEAGLFVVDTMIAEDSQ